MKANKTFTHVVTPVDKRTGATAPSLYVSVNGTQSEDKQKLEAERQARTQSSLSQFPERWSFEVEKA